MRYSDCNTDSRPLHCSMVRPSMDRPPSYNEACSALLFMKLLSIKYVYFQFDN